MKGKRLPLLVLAALALAGFGVGLHQKAQLDAARESQIDPVTINPDKLDLTARIARLETELQNRDIYIAKLKADLDEAYAEELALAEQLQACRNPPVSLEGKSRAERVVVELERTLIPELSFEKEPLSEVLTFLLETGREHEYKGFTLKSPTAGEPEVTINFRRLSLKDALDFICDMTDMEYSVEDTGIIVVRPSQKPRAKYKARMAELSAVLKLTPKENDLFNKAVGELITATWGIDLDDDGEAAGGSGQPITTDRIILLKDPEP